MLNTVYELPEFQRKAADLLSESERKSLIDYLAFMPLAGDLMEGTGGIRKLRWGRGNRGKSVGVRVIYYFHDDRYPLYLLTVFAKNDQRNLSKSEQQQLSSLVDLLLKSAMEKWP